MRKISNCEKCGSHKLENWGESGTFWVHCYSCNYDHEDDSEVDPSNWRGFDDEVLVYPPKRRTDENDDFS